MVRFQCFGLAMVGALLVGSSGVAQDASPNEREVMSLPQKVGRTDVWSLDMRFKDPRIIKVEIPGRGERICWYLWYQVINRTEKAVAFKSPIFELVTHDYPGSYSDEILPTAEAAIRKLEDPSGYLNIKNSFTITQNLIPVSKPAEEAFPIAVTGVAIWDASPADLKGRNAAKKDLSDCTQFSIFIRGMSNGFVEVDPAGPGLPPQVRDKTLQLKFKRGGDRYSIDSRDISFVAPHEWTYRPSARTLIQESKDKSVEPKGPAPKE